MITSERCLLRLASKKDVSTIIEFYKNNKEHFRPWDPYIPDEFYTLNYWNKKVHDFLIEFEEKQSLRLHIFSKESLELIGMVSFSRFERGIFQSCGLRNIYSY